MNHSRSKMSRSPSPSKNQRMEPKHWSGQIHETIVSAGPEGLLNLVVHGGAENGQFCYIGDIRQERLSYHSGKLYTDEIILEIQGQKVSGFTSRDILDWMKHVSKNAQPVMFKTVKSSVLTRDLREYLTTRFQKNSLDHDLQQTVRDNVYRRTVPCTTRNKRPGEIDGVDYKFLTVDEFLALEKTGSLLESGIYGGKHYGTPQPSKDPAPDNPFRRTNSMGTLLAGQHPSSEGKRRRNRSNIEMTSVKKETAPVDQMPQPLPPPLTRKKSLERAQSTSSSMGPLPSNWEMAYTEEGTPYFIEYTTSPSGKGTSFHSNETTHWLDPRLANNQKLSPLDCNSTELPYGWEKVEDSVYGTYFIDHVNRKTQYENPVVQAKRIAKERDPMGHNDKGSHTEMNGRRSPPPAYEVHRPFFTKNPELLKGEFLKTELQKSPRGFGFTIVGGDDSDEEFLQVKSVVPNGPAFQGGKICRGDVLVYINDTLVLGYTHSDVVTLFQSIPIGGKVTLEVCRGYQLPFDPDDPNTEIVTTIAVTLPPGLRTNNTTSSSHNSVPAQDGRGVNMDGLGQVQRSIKSMPDLTNPVITHDHHGHRNNKSFDDTHNEDGGPPVPPPSARPQLMMIPIVKGTMGFGFTIADSCYGQKVKQILDKPRCKTLLEGDILVQINNQKVKDVSHSDVVKVLKECAKGIESDIHIQRGGILTPNRNRKAANRSPKSGTEEGSGQSSSSEPTYTNVPTSTFYSPGKKNNKEQEKENNQQKEQREKEEQKKENVKVSDSQNPKSSEDSKKGDNKTEADNKSDYPDGGDQYRREPPPRPPSESRSKTPTPGDPIDYPRPQDIRGSGRPPFLEMSNPPRDFPPPYGPAPDYDPRGRHPGYAPPDYPAGSKGVYPPQNDYPVQHGYPPPRRDAVNLSFSELHSRGGVPPGERGEPRFRSRTPGPEMMRGAREARDDEMHYRRPDARSKTPTHELQQQQQQQQQPQQQNPTSRQLPHNISGTPDFIPASLYQAPGPRQYPNPNPRLPQDSNFGDRIGGRLNNASDVPPSALPPYGHSPNTQHPPPPRLASPSGNPYNRGESPLPTRPYNNYTDPRFTNNIQHMGAPPPPHPTSPTYDPASRARKQSTSFENEEPTPSSLTRLHRYGESPSGSLDHSPARPSGEERYIEMSVTLKRQDNGFGFRIIGGTEEGSQVSIGLIVPGGSADMDGRMAIGDEILSVDGVPVMGSSHRRVVQLMGQCSHVGTVSIGLRRRIGDMPYRAPQDGYPYDVTVMRRENEGFGFVIISSVTRSGSVIGKIIEGSPAERCGAIHVGDRILAVNAIDIVRMHHEEIVNLIKDSGYSVRLTVGSPQGDETSSNVSSTQRVVGNMVNAMAYPAQSDSDLSHRSDYSPYHTPPSSQLERYQPVLDKSREPNRQRPNAQLSLDVDDDKFYAVELHRGSRGFGFSIRGGKEFDNMPLFVLRIAEGGAAHLDGRLRVGDQLIEINSYNTNHMTHAEAIELISSGGSTVRLLVKRTGKPPPNIGGNVRSPTSINTSLPNGPLRPAGQSSPVNPQPPNSRNNPYYINQYPANQSRGNIGYKPITAQAFV